MSQDHVLRYSLVKMAKASLDKSIESSANLDVWTVNKLSDCATVVFWEIHNLLKTESVNGIAWTKNKTLTFQGHKYQLMMTHQVDKITLTIKNSSSDGIDDDRVTKITAMHHGEVVEMKSGADVWGPVMWKNNFALPVQGSYCAPYPNFQLILEHPSKAVKVDEKLAHLARILDTGFMSDIQFEIKGKVMGAHLAIVASASPVMAAMFEPGRFQEGDQRSVKIIDIEPDVFQQMIRYVYTSVAPKLAELAESLFLAADKYQIDPLRRECEDFLSCKLTLENVIHLLVMAHKHSASNLLEACLKFMKQHRVEFWNRPEWEELSGREPAIFFLATKRMYSKSSLKRKLSQ